MRRRDLLAASAAAPLAGIAGARPRNILFILSDDHRYDAMGFMAHPFLQTPAFDRMAAEGVHFENAFVTTSLCSPSRASVLTGMYAHRHGVVDNASPEPPGLAYFPQYLQKAGYDTAFIGKWHMGGGEPNPRPGFNHWISFRGQGSYNPSERSPLNINGKTVPQRGYITDELTDYAIDWLGQKRDRPFFLYLSHKAVHGSFIPAKRHLGKYQSVRVTPPPTQANTPENFSKMPRWVKDQRNSTHGADFADQRTVPLETNYKSYCETLLALDEGIGRVLDELDRRKELDSTLVVYMGDNGYQWGEHGLQDKRTAYEASIRVPMLARCPELFGRGKKVPQMVLNVDIAPTLLDAAGLRAPAEMQGRSFLAPAQGKSAAWRDHFLYEYFWERNYPQTPTIHAIRTDRYKYIHYHGVWDTDELYDLQQDPHEINNLIASADHRELIQKLNKQLFDELEANGGMTIRLRRDAGNPQVLRRHDGPKPADFPEWMIEKKPRGRK